jgi:hypothetical protein
MSTIQQKFSSLGGAKEFGAPIGKLEKVDVTDTEDGTNAQGKPTKPIKVTEHIGEFQLYQHGVIAVHKEVNKLAFGVHGPIFPLSKWGPGSALGWPTGDSQEIKKNGKSVGWSSAFESQSLYMSAGASAAITLSDPIRRKYEDLGGPAGWLGFPLGGKKATPDGRGSFVEFEHGIIVSGDTGTHEVHGLIRKRWEAMGAEKGLGFPLTDELPIAGTKNKFSDFENGVIRWINGDKTATNVAPLNATIGGQKFPVSRDDVIAKIGTLVAQIIGKVKLSPPAESLTITVPTSFRILDGKGLTTGYAHSGNHAINRRLRTRTCLNLGISGGPDASIVLDLDVVVSFDSAKSTVVGSIYEWWYDVHIGWPAGDSDAKKIADKLKSEIGPLVGVPQKIASAPAGVSILSLKTMADGSIDVFL